jgi:hypothetical protein
MPQDKVYTDNRKKKEKESSTVRPLKKEEKCPFTFAVLWDGINKCFKMKGGLGCRSQAHHFPKDPVEICRGLGYTDEEQRQIAIDLFASGSTSGNVRNYYLETCGDILADGTLDYLRRTALKLKDKARACAAGGEYTIDEDKNLTETEKLMQLLKATPGVSFHAIYSELDSSLMTSNRRDFKTSQKRRLRSVIRQRGGTMEQDGDLFDFDDIDIDNCNDFKTYEARHRRAMSIPDEKRMLLIIAWTTDKSYRQFCQFPHCTSSDVTEKVNNVQRTLYILALSTANCKNVPVVWAYLPSQARWSFNCIWTKSIPALLPQPALIQMSVHLTDGDAKLYEPFREAAPTIFSVQVLLVLLKNKTQLQMSQQQAHIVQILWRNTILLFNFHDCTCFFIH